MSPARRLLPTRIEGLTSSLPICGGAGIPEREKYSGVWTIRFGDVRITTLCKC